MEKKTTAIASTSSEAPVESSRARNAAPEGASSARVPSASVTTSATRLPRDQPQQLAKPNWTLLLGTPLIGLAVMRFTPVSW